MSYVDAMFDRDADIIRVVERKEGKRHFTEYPIKYTFYIIYFLVFYLRYNKYPENWIEFP